jgi:hypothetical protein
MKCDLAMNNRLAWTVAEVKLGVAAVELVVANAKMRLAPSYLRGALAQMRDDARAIRSHRRRPSPPCWQNHFPEGGRPIAGVVMNGGTINSLA